MSVITRFAPSPTGYLHIGGVRTALFSWLYAKQQQGQFILRIEDTDKQRSTQASVDAILEGMAWLGLDYDQGPFFQTQRMARYQQVIQQLLDQGDAYRCYCTKEALDALRQQQIANKQKPRYDGRCRDKIGQSSGDYVIRFRNPSSGDVMINDWVKGKVIVKNQELDDLIIARSDGSPTYNLTVVVDDMDMGMTHVIRGDDHLNNTPRQINILLALGATPPEYIHVPMILNDQGKRLSKRDGAVGVMQYQQQGYLPQAVLNYLVRLGWSYGDQEIFSIEEMMAKFDLTKINKSAAVFNHEKLLWLNHQYIMQTQAQDLVQPLVWQFKQLGIDKFTQVDLVAVIRLQQERCKTLLEMAERSQFFYQDFIEYDEKAAKKFLKPVIFEGLTALLTQLSNLASWQAEAIHQVIHQVAEQQQLKLGKLAQPFRVAITGGSVSPPIDKTAYLIGKERTLQRLQQGLDYIQNGFNSSST